MPELYEVSNWMDALKASPLFPIALPVILATAFSGLADWFDHYFAMYRQGISQWHADEPCASASQANDRELTPPVVNVGRAHDFERY
jgi:hypothetical protein